MTTRWLSRSKAARYCGVQLTAFDAHIRPHVRFVAIWRHDPPGFRRRDFNSGTIVEATSYADVGPIGLKKFARAVLKFEAQR